MNVKPNGAYNYKQKLFSLSTFDSYSWNYSNTNKAARGRIESPPKAAQFSLLNSAETADTDTLELVTHQVSEAAYRNRIYKIGFTSSDFQWFTRVTLDHGEADAAIALLAGFVPIFDDNDRLTNADTVYRAIESIFTIRVERTKQRWTPKLNREQDLEIALSDRVNELKRLGGGF